ncbi:uncharacterized protein LOC144173585 [Haemaphysalis longicornis]
MFFNEKGLRGVQKEEEGASTPVKTRVVLAGATGSDAVCDEAETARKLVDQSHSLHVAPGENRTPIALFPDEYALSARCARNLYNALERAPGAFIAMEVGEVESLGATIPQSRSVTQCNLSITPPAGGDVTAVASTSSSLGGEDKSAKRRARNAERMRLKRAADAELRAREAAAKRQRRAEDPEVRAKDAAFQRQRRAENAEVRAREARRAANPRVKRREAETKRQRRAADLAGARERGRAARAATRSREFARPDARFRRDFEAHSFGHSCKVCDRLWFDNNLSVIGNTRKESSRLNALRVLWNEFGRGGAGGDAIIAVSDDNPRLAPFKSYLVCASCRESLVSGRVPWVSVSLGYRYPPRPAHLHDLNAVEERLISPRLPFMSTRRLTRGNGQFGIKGQVVNVPIDVPSVVECLPRMVPEDLAFEVHIKRRLLSPATYKRGLVKRGNILAWLKHLEHTPLYRAINVRFEWSRLEHFDDGETDEGGEGEPKDDDGDIETIPDDFDVNDPLQLAIALNAVSKTMFFNEEGLRGVQREEEEDASTPVKTRVVLAGATGSDAVCEEAETVRKLVYQSHSLHVAPGENRTPIALFLDEYAEEFAFPTIYLGMPRYITGLRPTPFLKASSEIRRTERRGATPEHVLYMAAKVMRYNVAETAMTFRTNAATDSITREQLEKGGKRFLDEMLDRDLGFLRGVPNTVQYWQDRRKDLFAMIRQLGKPHAFLTMSASEVHWERLLETLERLRVGPAGRARVIAEMMAWERVELVNNDPVTCAIYTNRIFDVIMNVLNDKRCSPFKPYVVRDYFKRVEFQQRARARHPVAGKRAQRRGAQRSRRGHAQDAGDGGCAPDARHLCAQTPAHADAPAHAHVLQARANKVSVRRPIHAERVHQDSGAVSSDRGRCCG